MNKEQIESVGIDVDNRWKEYKLEEIATIQTGPFGSQLHMSDYKMSGTPIITVEHLGENKILHNNLPLVSNEDKQRLIKYTLKEGDIVFSRVGSVDRRAYVSSEEDGWMFSGRLLRVRVNKDKVCPKFLSFYFGQESFKETIRRIAVGATMPSINTTILSEIEVVIPQKKEQTAIASILSSLDDKIDLLHRQNKTLEQLAETLFRQWFVEEAEDSWEEKTLGEITDIKAGGDKPKIYSEIKTEKCNIPIYSNGIDKDGLYGYTDKARIDIECITISARGTIGFVRLRQEPFVPIVRLISIIPNENYLSSKFLYLWAKSQNISGTGTTQEQLTVPDFSGTTIILPPIEKMKEFTNYVNSLFIKIEFNQTQIRTLTQTRDTLLPKLMSGEVRVEM